MKPYYLAVPTLLDAGIPVLIYAGDADFICNWLGNQAWTDALEYSDHEKFAKAPVKKWKMSSTIGDVKEGTHVGETKNYGNFTFLRVFEAGKSLQP